MKKKILAILVCVVLLISVVPWRSAFAYDPVSLTFNQLAGAAFGLGSALGINWTFRGTASNASEVMISALQKFGGNDISWWGSEFLRVQAGKLIVPLTIYTKLRAFIQDLVDNDEDIAKIANVMLGDEIPNGSILSSGFSTILGATSDDTSYLYYNGSQIATGRPYAAMSNSDIIGSSILLSSGQWRWYLYGVDRTTGNSKSAYYRVSGNFPYYGSFPDYTNYDASSFPEVLGDNQQFSIDTGEAPDTNLDQLLGGIFDGLADLGDITAEGEVIDVGPAPTPVPTPYPVDPDTPLQDVPWEGLNDLIGATGESVNEQIQIQTQSITSAQEATKEAVESLTDTIEGALDVPATEELPDFKFDLREFFPFCIPFDIYRLLSSFDAEPVAPHVQIPFVIESLNFSYNIDLDFSVFDPVAQVLRTVEFIVYALGLAWATGKVIKW